jgi:hypothetical protein
LLQNRHADQTWRQLNKLSFSGISILGILKITHVLPGVVPGMRWVIFVVFINLYQTFLRRKRNEIPSN